MTRRFEYYWYKEDRAIKAAFLYNTRDNDLWEGGSIARCEIVKGCCGYVVAEKSVPDYSGNIVAFKPNRRCEWQGAELPCMALEGLPAGPVPLSGPGSVRHKHHVVARVDDPGVAASMVEQEVPVITTEGDLSLVNLEVTALPNNKSRRARLL